MHFNKKQYSDVTFMIGKKEDGETEPIYASSSVLSSRSEYFEAMFRSQMRESIEGVVKVPDCSCRGAYLKMLEYVCLDDFTLIDDDAISSEMLRELEWLADKYLLEGLGLLCRHIEDLKKQERIDYSPNWILPPKILEDYYYE